MILKGEKDLFTFVAALSKRSVPSPSCKYFTISNPTCFIQILSYISFSLNIYKIRSILNFFFFFCLCPAKKYKFRHHFILKKLFLTQRKINEPLVVLGLSSLLILTHSNDLSHEKGNKSTLFPSSVFSKKQATV